MNRESYLKELKEQLYSLTEEEQNEAMEYYTSYFDEADDFEKAAAELGTPEELAASIKEKIAGVPAKTGKEEEKKSEEKAEKKTDSKKSESYDCSGWNKIAKFSFDRKKIRNWDFDFGAAHIVIVPNKDGDRYVIEARNIDCSVFSCEVSQRGTLMISNKVLVNGGFFSFNQNNEHHPDVKNPPRILIKTPEAVSVEKIKINMNAGKLEMREVPVECKNAYMNLGAGEMKLSEVRGGEIHARCGMGNLIIEGTCSGDSVLDCGMGNLEMKVTGNPEEYSYSATVGLGAFSFNEAEKNGIGTLRSEKRKDNIISAKVGMGKIRVSVKE